MRTIPIFLLLLLPVVPTVLLAGTVQAPPNEFAAAHPATASWLFGITIMALIAAVATISRVVTRAVNDALNRNEKAIQCTQADVRGLDTRLTILETQHRSHHGGTPS